MIKMEVCYDYAGHEVIKAPGGGEKVEFGEPECVVTGE